MDNAKIAKPKYKSCDLDSLPEAEIYTGDSRNGEAIVSGIPLYPDDVPLNPRLRRFVVSGCQDIWAALIFIALVIMTIVWGAVNTATNYTNNEKNVNRPSRDGTNNNNNNKNNNNSQSTLDMSPLQSFLTIGILFAISVIGAFGSLLLLNYFPRQLIYIANALTAVLLLVASVLSIAAGSGFSSILLLLMCVMQALWLYCVRDRIPFSAELLKASSTILSRYKAIFAFNFFVGILAVIYLNYWSAMAVSPKGRNEETTGGNILFIFFLLILFWVSQVIPNLMHVTTAGVTATWYFAGEGQMPRNPTLHSFKRAATTSFGSVCFGSLIVAVVRVMRWLAQSSGDNENEFVRCILTCILQCLESLVEYFNTYAFVHVAVYGCSYIEAAKRTWALCKQCAFAAYFNDALISITLGLLNVGVSLLIGVIVGLIYGESVYGFFAFLISFLVHSLFFSAVESSVTTLFVCFAEMPEGLQHSAPTLYAALHDTDQNGTNINAMHP